MCSLASCPHCGGTGQRRYVAIKVDWGGGTWAHRAAVDEVDDVRARLAATFLGAVISWELDP